MSGLGSGNGPVAGPGPPLATRRRNWEDISIKVGRALKDGALTATGIKQDLLVNVEVRQRLFAREHDMNAFVDARFAQAPQMPTDLIEDIAHFRRKFDDETTALHAMEDELKDLEILRLLLSGHVRGEQWMQQSRSTTLSTQQELELLRGRVEELQESLQRQLTSTNEATLRALQNTREALEASNKHLATLRRLTLVQAFF
ncbi:hypothetical protein CALCODRAFT_522028 [Calocera cornea HHB12733]|uniref:Uncharacterized protein n=1 Tax=Calocera cornea HHB12733 TaxID=1353952 RepID=A0A165C6E7_9BASI|nr:hypothetical protein CALCODRAFT_522028 [Calocera cornea HHB12733]